MQSIEYSWILPIKDEVLSLPQIIGEIKEVMKGQSFEIIAIDDASKDETKEVLEKIAKDTPQLKFIHLKSQEGKWFALSLGLKKAKGETIITSDSDLQDDPREFPKLLTKLEKGYDLVSGWRKKRHDPFYKVLISKLGNLLVSFLTKKKFHDLNSPFKVYRREVLNNLASQGSLLRFTILFAYNLGFKVAEVAVHHRPRFYGKSKFGVVKYLRILYDLVLVLLLFSGSGRLYNLPRKKIR